MRKIRSKTGWATAAAAALLWSGGCRTDDRDENRAPTPDELALQAQRESERAFGKAKEAQEAARDEQREAATAEKEAAEERQEAIEAEQEAREQREEAVNAQQEAQLQGEAAQQEARAAQERALQAQQQAQAEAQRQAMPETGEPVRPTDSQPMTRYPARPTEPTAPAQPGEPVAEHDPWAAPVAQETPPTDTTTATTTTETTETTDGEPWWASWVAAAQQRLDQGTVATTGTATAGTETADGIVETASAEELVLRRALGEDLELKVDAERTVIVEDGKPVTIDAISDGANVEVSYRNERGQAVAERIEVKDRAPAAPVSPRS